jgi:signal transduction histidine kinase
MTAAGRAGTVAGMRFARGSAGGRWRSGAVQDGCLTAALLVAAELEVVLDGLGADCAAVAALATVPLALRRRLPTVSFVCVAVLAPTLDRALGSPWGENANALVFLILVAAYSVAAHAPFRRSLPTVLGAAVWLAALEAVWGDGQDYAFVVLLLGVPWLSGRGVRRYRQREARLRALASRLERERAVSGRVAVARERQRMAHETHDAIAHAVGEMVLQASGAEEMLDSDPRRARTALTAVQQTGREAVEQLRGVLGMLRSGDESSLSVGSDEMALDIAAVARRRSFPASLDVGVALILFVLGARYAFAATALAGQRAPALLLQMLAASAVAFRGPRPIMALSIAVAAYAGEALLVDGDPGSPAAIAALLITIYSAAERATRLGAVAVAALALATPAAIAVAIAGDDAADVLLPVTILGVPWLTGRAVAAYRRQGDELSALAQRLARERDERARLAVLDERGRVARELHDSVAHAVSVMVLQAGGAEQLLDTEPERARAAVRTIQDVGRDALAQLGTLLGLLQPTDDGPPLAPRPGLADLERLLGTVRRAGLPVRLTTLGEPQPLPAAVDGAAYRVIQEALTNALKHSGAAATEVTVRYSAEGVQLDIVDTGPRAPQRATAGHGLAGMRERVGHHGGRLQVGPAMDGPGFAVSAFLPYAPTPPVDPERVHA